MHSSLNEHQITLLAKENCVFITDELTEQTIVVPFDKIVSNAVLYNTETGHLPGVQAQQYHRLVEMLASAQEGIDSKREPCLFCGKTIFRKRYKSGSLESVKIFKSRKFCSLKCWCQSESDRFSKLGSTNKNTIRKRSHKHLKPNCERCGASQHLDAHHVDLNRANNSPENIMTLCKSCHSKWHHEHRKANGIQLRIPQAFNCIVCGEKAISKKLCRLHYKEHRQLLAPQCSKCDKKASAKGLCDNHYRLWAKTHPKTVHPKNCTLCGIKAVCMGLCRIHYNAKYRSEKDSCVDLKNPKLHSASLVAIDEPVTSGYSL